MKGSVPSILVLALLISCTQPQFEAIETFPELLFPEAGITYLHGLTDVRFQHSGFGLSYDVYINRELHASTYVPGWVTLNEAFDREGCHTWHVVASNGIMQMPSNHQHFCIEKEPEIEIDISECQPFEAAPLEFTARVQMGSNFFEYAMGHDVYGSNIYLLYGYNQYLFNTVNEDSPLLDITMRSWPGPADWNNKHGEGGMAFDTKERRFLYFSPGSEIPERNKVYELTVDDTGPTKPWTILDVVGERPDGRDEHSVIYDSRRHQLILFGGYTRYLGTVTADLWNDLWILDLNQVPLEWEQIQANDWNRDPTPRGMFQSVYSEALDVMAFFGGSAVVFDGEEYSDSLLARDVSEAWLYHVERNEWELSATLPGYRSETEIVLVSSCHALMIGGIFEDDSSPSFKLDPVLWNLHDGSLTPIDFSLPEPVRSNGSIGLNAIYDIDKRLLLLAGLDRLYAVHQAEWP